MQTDQPMDSATATDRRTFLTRTAIGGALVTAGALAGPVGGLVIPAFAQSDEVDPESTDAGFAIFASNIEWAAVQIYQTAIESGQLDDEWLARARSFQSHHQDVVTALEGLLDTEGPEPEPDRDLRDQVQAQIEAATDQDGVLLALAEVEDGLSGSHLRSVGILRDATTAKIVSQVLAVEAQQAALLAVGGGTPIAEATPAVATTDGAIEFEAVEAEAAAEAESGDSTTDGGSGAQPDSGGTQNSDTGTAENSDSGSSQSSDSGSAGSSDTSGN